MDSLSNTKPSSKPTSPNSVPIRVSRSTARLLRSIIAKCNRKSHGRKVKADDIIQRSLQELQDFHFEKIKESTYSSQDRLEIEFKKYCQNHGSISKDKFLSLLVSNGLPTTSPIESGDPSALPQDDGAAASDDIKKTERIIHETRLRS